jgi:CDGSH-type Zn-finger protein
MTITCFAYKGGASVMAMYETKSAYILVGESTVQVCACGQAGRPPYCDGSHKGPGQEPSTVEIIPGETVNIAAAAGRTSGHSATGPVILKSLYSLFFSGSELMMLLCGKKHTWKPKIRVCFFPRFSLGI